MLGFTDIRTGFLDGLIGFPAPRGSNSHFRVTLDFFFFARSIRFDKIEHLAWFRWPYRRGIGLEPTTSHCPPYIPLLGFQEFTTAIHHARPVALSNKPGCYPDILFLIDESPLESLPKIFGHLRIVLDRMEEEV